MIHNHHYNSTANNRLSDYRTAGRTTPSTNHSAQNFFKPNRGASAHSGKRSTSEKQKFMLNAILSASTTSNSLVDAKKRLKDIMVGEYSVRGRNGQRGGYTQTLRTPSNDAKTEYLPRKGKIGFPRPEKRRTKEL
jgi:hypothetical protein